MAKRLKYRPPIPYYGGKQTIGPAILPLFPAHNVYVEAFAGGGSLFFLKEPSQFEVLNDTNGEIENFYRVLQRAAEALGRLAVESMHSQRTFNEARALYDGFGAVGTEVERAWAFWYLSQASFGGATGDGAFGYGLGPTNMVAKKLIRSAQRLSDAGEWRSRMEGVTVRVGDALEVIRSYDRGCGGKEVFYYCDPPYLGTDCGHYKNYSEANYGALLSLLAGIRGKFALSSYANPQLSAAAAENEWVVESIGTRMMANNRQGEYGSKKDKGRVELVVMNYGAKERAGGGGLFG